MQLKNLTPAYAPQILEIFNDAILNSTALYDYEPRTLENMNAWFKTKDAGNYPVIGLVDENDQLLGFGSYGTFRERAAYKPTVEHSIYIHKDHRGKGLGKILMPEIINAAKLQGYHCIMAGIDASNAVSIKLHEQFGFREVGVIKEVGFKFNRWLDLAFYQLLIG
ncbi:MULTISPECIES: GNAT family N-acetyltransferase [unclassified Paraflavitalea]|uniref:GNAT family N-acetyltransferase n=1 Tax=unclassified Paraflavitalea TaxID=2798305 RepID=UPI003D34EBEA